MAMNYIGADVDSKMTELAVRRKGKIVARRRVQTSITENRRLKSVAIGAAMSAIHSSRNVFRDHYEKLLRKSVTCSNARHTVARKIITVMWGMWKTTRRFDPQWV